MSTQILTDQSLNRVNHHFLEEIRSEILDSFVRDKHTLWSRSKNGGKYKLSGSRIDDRTRFPAISRVASDTISGKVMRDYFISLKKTSTLASNSKPAVESYSLALGREILERYAPQFINPDGFWGLKINPVQLRSFNGFDTLRQAALDIQAETKVTPAVPSLHLSLLKHGSYIPIHVDDQSKILSVMLYLPTPEQDNSTDMGTSFWYPSSQDFQIYDADGSLGYSGDKVQNQIRSNFLEYKTPFSTGSIVSFLKTSSSWHSFHYGGRNLGPRISLNLNIHSLL